MSANKVKGSDDMNLNERKIKILQAIIDDYVETAEPVGSRTIAKKYDLGISSATIRNEMADLEELGFIIQPHTSSGRIPSDKGYRLYVDQMMEYKELSKDKTHIIEQILANNINKIDFLMQETAKILSLLTNYTTLVSQPQIQKTKLKHIQLIPLDEKSVILIVVTDGNLVRNHVLNMNEQANQETLYVLSNMLNQHLQGLTMEQINLPLIQSLKQQMGAYEELLSPVLDAIAETIQSAQNADVYMSGATNMLSCPEFSDIVKAKALFHTLEEKEILAALLAQNTKQGIQVTIGDENEIQEVKACSIITTSYQLGSNVIGNIGIIGPTRMDYGKVVSVLSYITKNLDEVLRRLSGG